VEKRDVVPHNLTTRNNFELELKVARLGIDKGHGALAREVEHSRNSLNYSTSLASIKVCSPECCCRDSIRIPFALQQGGRGGGGEEREVQSCQSTGGTNARQCVMINCEAGLRWLTDSLHNQPGAAKRVGRVHNSSIDMYNNDVGNRFMK
jgi:hypothetical protein